MSCHQVKLRKKVKMNGNEEIDESRGSANVYNKFLWFFFT